MVGPEFDVLVMLRIRSGSGLGFVFIAAIEFVSGAGYFGHIDCKKIVVPESSSMLPWMSGFFRS